MPHFLVTAIETTTRRYLTVVEAQNVATARAIVADEDYEDWEEDIDSDDGLPPNTVRYIDSIEELNSKDYAAEDEE